ncbi:polysaccharide deacetylase family protein [Sporosarcina trichiuri]|uniref:polysaccharide deacetylase family protein n=1 Tax=Sporosarcina trichiuri TaxID=3056445 RepID=UPI0025B2C2A1|nr:polysaccharide deacetylase family protein [Sporosarcina sp. 0.2-SM1T-5]WJY27505.1 polysaccharide deacetylase family protein [Sporosarcina sp. 0.2-SM1T-5]
MKTSRWVFAGVIGIFIILIGNLLFSESAAGQHGGLPKDELRRKIQAYAAQHDIEPVDAVVDRVWKAVPGYNGWQVDRVASHERMKKTGRFDKTKLVFKETEPRLHLDDLDPHPIYRGNPGKPMVSLLINVAWGEEYIPAILQTLKNHEVSATFFFDGSWTAKNPKVAKTIHEAGHEIGNHAYSHPDLQKRSAAETREELQKTNEVIQQTLGIQPKWFGPPSGSFNAKTVAVADELGMKTILWTADTVDWKKPEPSEMVQRVLSQTDNGTMILMHPTDPVAKGLDEMIMQIKAKGLRLGTVSELMSEKRVD